MGDAQIRADQRSASASAERAARERQESERRSRPLLVRCFAPVLGHERADLLQTLLIAAWPFIRILTVIVMVWILAGIACYQFETRRTLDVNDADILGRVVRTTYENASGEKIVQRGEKITETAQSQLIAAGVKKVKVYYNDSFERVGDAIWWSIVTMTTVGYGDKYPETRAGRMVAVLLMFMSLGLLSSFTATFASAFVARRIQEAQQKRDLEWEGHTVFCGWNEMAPRILRVLNADSLGNRRQVVLINERTEEAMELQLRGYEYLEMRFIRGNFTREEDLRRANLTRAQTVIIIPDASEGTVPDDVKTIEATITMKDMAPDVKVFAHVLDPERVTNLRRAMVDDVVVSDEYIPELLAAYVTKPGMTQTVRELLDIDASTAECAVVEIPRRFHGGPVLDAWRYFREEENMTLIGLVAEEEAFGLDTAMEGGDTYIIEFIKEQIAEAGITTQEGGTRTRITVNPSNDHVVQEGDAALVVRARPTSE